MSKRNRNSYGPNPNRTRQLQAITGLDRLLGRYAAGNYTGSITVFVPVKDGRLGEPSFEAKRFAEPP